MEGFISPPPFPFLPPLFLDPEGGSQKATLVLVVVYHFSKNPYGFLNTQRSATKLHTHSC